MRELLYKAKLKNKDRWIKGFYCCKKETTYCFTEDYEKFPVKTLHYIIRDEMTDWGLPNEFRFYEIDPDTLCVFTGMTDKNGNKIWENDILLQKTAKNHWCQWKCIGVVKYGEHDWDESNYGYTSIGFYIEPIARKGDTVRIACGLNQVDINNESYPIEVIGNIFDNPELLKTERN